jgi:4,5-DOPA dioxygenase extradiol
VDVAARPRTIHDFHGFPAALYRMRYDAPGAPDLARDVARRIEAAGLGPVGEIDRGLDHGAWVPLSLLLPRADVPVTEVAVVPTADAYWHHAVGRALAPLRDANVLILATGSLTHNIAGISFDATTAQVWPPAAAFADGIARHALHGDVDALLDWLHTVPEAARNHPTPEHFLPFFVALGAGGEHVAMRRLHASFTFGAIAMDAYAFAAQHELGASGLA